MEKEKNGSARHVDKCLQRTGLIIIKMMRGLVSIFKEWKIYGCVCLQLCECVYVSEQTHWVCVQWKTGFDHLLALKVPIYSVVSKGVSWAIKGWDVLSFRGKNC